MAAFVFDMDRPAQRACQNWGTALRVILSHHRGRTERW
jgi:hypothetical protein